MVKLALAGVGLMGRQHLSAIARSDGVELAALVDPRPKIQEIAQQLNVPQYDSLPAMFDESRPDGVIIATPNALHVEHGMICVDHRCAMLIEKPIATIADDANDLVSAAEAAAVPILVGHHRRHNPLTMQAKAMIEEGAI